MTTERVKLTIYVDPELKVDIDQCRELLHEWDGARCSLQRFGEIAFQTLCADTLDTNANLGNTNGETGNGRLPSRKSDKPGKSDKPVKPKRK